MRAPDDSVRSTRPRRTEGDRVVLGYAAAVIGATVGGSAGLALTMGRMPMSDLAMVATFVALYSAVIVGILGPIGHWLLRRLRRQSRLAYALTGTLLGAGFTLAGGGSALSPDPFVTGGTLAGLCAGLAFGLIYCEPMGAA